MDLTVAINYWKPNCLYPTFFSYKHAKKSLQYFFYETLLKARELECYFRCLLIPLKDEKTTTKQKHWAKIISGMCLCSCFERLQTILVGVWSMANLGKPYTAAGHYKEGMSTRKPALSSTGRQTWIESAEENGKKAA